MNASYTPGEHARDARAMNTNLHHSSGPGPDHLSPVNDTLGTSERTFSSVSASRHDDDAPVNPSHYWQTNESFGGLQVVPEQSGLQLADDKEAALESVDELEPRSRVQHRLRRRTCGVPLWLLLLLGIVAIIGAVVGGILGGLKPQKKDDKPESNCHLIGNRNQTICGARPATLPSGTSQSVGTPHALPVNGSWYYLVNQITNPAQLVLSVSPNGALNVTKLGTETNVSAELWTFINYEDVAAVTQDYSDQNLATYLRTYRRERNITSPLYVIESAGTVNRTHLRLNYELQPYLTQRETSTVFDEEEFWWLEDKYDPGDFLLRNADEKNKVNETALAVWDVSGKDDAVGRLVMTPGVDEMKASGAWRIVPFGGT